MLGNALDDPKRLLAGAGYLERWAARTFTD